MERDQADPVFILRMFTELLPQRRQGETDTRTSDRTRISDMWKAQGGKHRTAALLLGGGGNMPHASVAGAQPFFSSPLLPPQAPLALGLGVTLPLAGAAGAQAGSAKKSSGATGTRTQPKAAAGGSGGGAGAGGASPQPPSRAAAQERCDFNSALRARQEAFLPSPFGSQCPECAQAGRNPYHRQNECASVECPKCKRGGHKPRRCAFPPYP